jgi:hypothetical protein
VFLRFMHDLQPLEGRAASTLSLGIGNGYSMKRARQAVLLTLFLLCAAEQGRAQGRDAGTDLDVTELVPVRDGAPGRLCPGTENAVRVAVAWHGVLAAKPASLRLSLVLPGGPAAGTLIAEGSIAGRPNSPTTTFTFLHVEISKRLRGRGARLVVRANLDGAIAERDLSNNVRELAIDAATDWSCADR